eukprot:CAMPEP_0184856898 /NCGR_PEP_ID=MMETSP0580-20130426/2060_1 /TAXON_ID=1118495 /ORGANISM="Dactyliosolen fragilissimus" /LENGTH=845 /DNA_ID=CAMNT_0027352163 /DNA_START=124 /DNA_END=2661 /DNA_ORIENTATION=-
MIQNPEEVKVDTARAGRESHRISESQNPNMAPQEMLVCPWIVGATCEQNQTRQAQTQMQTQMQMQTDQSVPASESASEINAEMNNRSIDSFVSTQGDGDGDGDGGGGVHPFSSSPPPPPTDSACSVGSLPSEDKRRRRLSLGAEIHHPGVTSKASLLMKQSQNNNPYKSAAHTHKSKTTLSTTSETATDKSTSESKSTSKSTAKPKSKTTTLSSTSTSTTPNNAYQPSLYQSRLLSQPSQAVEAVLAAACEGIGFDIAEMWLRTGPKTHQLTNSHLRPSALDDTLHQELIDVYYGQQSSERKHRLSPALCKRAKEAKDVVWVTANTEHGKQALRCSISDVRTAVAVPVSHEASHSNITIIYFSIKRAIMKPTAIEFLVHMSLAAAVSSVNSLDHQVMIDIHNHDHNNNNNNNNNNNSSKIYPSHSTSHHPPHLNQHPHPNLNQHTHPHLNQHSTFLDPNPHHHQIINHNHMPNQIYPHPQLQPPIATSPSLHYHTTSCINMSKAPSPPTSATITKLQTSVAGANLQLKWSCLQNVEYLTDGGNNWIHTAVMDRKAVVVKTLKPECHDLVLAINEIEAELNIHSRLNHPNICNLYGAGTTSRGSRFIILERLDGGTLSQVLGYDTRIRDRRKRFWKRKRLTYQAALNCAKSIASAMKYCNDDALKNTNNVQCNDTSNTNTGMILHRDLKPDNIGFTINGTVKLIDFGLARIIGNASSEANDVYQMSGETGSLRYMAPEVAASLPYNHKADVYSFGILLWELMAYEKPFDGMNREMFYERVVHGGERPPIQKKWPSDLISLMTRCWSYNPEMRPTFSQIHDQLSSMLREKTLGTRKKTFLNRQSAWF